MSKQSDKSSLSKDYRAMNAQTLARDLVIAAAGERGWQTTRASWLRDAARRLGLTYARCRSIFYGEARLIGADEWRQLVARADALGIKQQWQEAHEEHRASDRGGVLLPREPLPDLDGRAAVRGQRAAQELGAAPDASPAGEPVS